MTSTDYIINFQDILGYGNYGTVYGAIKKIDNKPYAVKIFKSSDASAEEIDIMQYLSNYEFEYIANIEEVLTINGRKAIVMERLDGGEVFERILNDGHFSEHRAAKCLVSLTKALIDLNKTALVLHRDVKPENLVYISQEPTSEVKLIDFGLAIKTSPFSIEQGIRLGKRPAGTASYMSPETIKSCEYSAKSDVWSAGVTLYALLSGTAPFDQDNRLKQRQQILSGTYLPLDSSSWSHVSKEAKDLIKQMLTVNPNDRISLEDILVHPWIQMASTVPPVNFDEGYFNEIRSLSARSNFKKIVNATVLTIRLRRNALTTALKSPLSEASPKGSKSMTNLSDFNTTTEGNGSVSDDSNKSSDNNNRNNNDVDSSNSNMVIDDKPKRAMSDGLPGFTKEQIKDLKERFAVAAAESAARVKMEHNHDGNRELAVDYQAFEAVMYAVGLEGLATPHVFNIFDTDGNGMVDYREFISTLATFRTSDAEAMRLYFDMFDVDGSGEISFEELKLVMAAMLHEDDEDNLHSEHDRSSPAPDMNVNMNTTPSDSMMDSKIETVLSSDNAIEDSTNLATSSVFQFVPDDGSNPMVISPRENRTDRAISPVSEMLPISHISSTSSGASNSSNTSHGSFARMASLMNAEHNPFQSVFRFAPKAEEGRTIEDLFREMDTNKDGKISFEEFKGWMERDMQKLKNVVQDALN